MAYGIFLSPPNMGGKEIEKVMEVFRSNWIAPHGPAIGELEDRLASYIGTGGALAVSSGTAALHLVLRWLGIGEGDLVFCSDFTFIGSCSPILFERATPVFIDSEPGTWNMSPAALERAFQWAEKSGAIPRAVIVVDLFGESADWDSLLPICRKYGAAVIEDAAEALGTAYKGRMCGTFGDFSILSFNGNKIITTSGGGMVLSNDADALEKMRFWATQAREPLQYYEHREYGYNYRMSNVCAAIGLGQLEFLDTKIKLRRMLHERYISELRGIPAHIKEHLPACVSNCWLNALYIESDAITPSDIVTGLQAAGIEARHVWKPMHMQPVFGSPVFFPHHEEGALDEVLFERAVCLPSGDGMSEEQFYSISGELKKIFSGRV